MQAIAYGVESSQAQQIQCRGAQHGQHTSAIAAVAVLVLVELRVADPVPAFNAPAPRISRSRASGVVRRLVRNKCLALNGLPSRLPLATSSTIQAVPGQSTLMCSGASYRFAEAFG